jgi:hypothetical protein
MAGRLNQADLQQHGQQVIAEGRKGGVLCCCYPLVLASYVGLPTSHIAMPQVKQAERYKRSETNPSGESILDKLRPSERRYSILKRDEL